MAVPRSAGTSARCSGDPLAAIEKLAHSLLAATSRISHSAAYHFQLHIPPTHTHKKPDSAGVLKLSKSALHIFRCGLLKCEHRRRQNQFWPSYAATVTPVFPVTSFSWLTCWLASLTTRLVAGQATRRRLWFVTASLWWCCHFDVQDLLSIGGFLDLG